MTDKEKLIKLFDEFGIGYDVVEDNDGTQKVLLEKGNKKVIGYNGFFTEFYFDGEGKFIEVGIWE